MKCVTFTVQLQESAKEFRYLMAYAKNAYRCYDTSDIRKLI